MLALAVTVAAPEAAALVWDGITLTDMLSSVCAECVDVNQSTLVALLIRSGPASFLPCVSPLSTKTCHV